MRHHYVSAGQPVELCSLCKGSSAQIMHGFGKLCLWVIAAIILAAHTASKEAKADKSFH